jgi:hypothetical protein
MSKPLRLAIVLRRVQDCDDIKELLPDVMTDADARVLPRLI